MKKLFIFICFTSCYALSGFSQSSSQNYYYNDEEVIKLSNYIKDLEQKISNAEKGAEKLANDNQSGSALNSQSTPISLLTSHPYSDEEVIKLSSYIKELEQKLIALNDKKPFTPADITTIEPVEEVEEVEEVIPVESKKEEVVVTKKTVSGQQEIIFKVQIAAIYQFDNIEYFEKTYGISENINMELHKGWYKYSIGEYTEYETARSSLENIVTKYKINTEPFIVAYNKGQRISLQEAFTILKQK